MYKDVPDTCKGLAALSERDKHLSRYVSLILSSVFALLLHEILTYCITRIKRCVQCTAAREKTATLMRNANDVAEVPGERLSRPRSFLLLFPYGRVYEVRERKIRSRVAAAQEERTRARDA